MMRDDERLPRNHLVRLLNESSLPERTRNWAVHAASLGPELIQIDPPSPAEYFARLYKLKAKHGREGGLDVGGDADLIDALEREGKGAVRILSLDSEPVYYFVVFVSADLTRLIGLMYMSREERHPRTRSEFS